MIAFLLACSDPGPHAIDVPAALEIRSIGPYPLPVRILDAKGRPLPEVPWTATAADPSVLAVGEGGVVRCLDHGASRLDIEASPLRRSVVVQCNLVREVRVRPETAWLEVGGPGREVAWEVLGPGGAPLPRVEPEIVVVDPSVARWDGQRVRAVAPGRTEVRVTAGGEVAGVVDVRAGSPALVREEVPVAAGGSLVLPMNAGTWRVQVRAGRPVEIRPQDGTCSGEEGRSARQHRLTCTFRPGGTLSIRRPGVPGLGGDATVTVRGVWFPES